MVPSRHVTERAAARTHCKEVNMTRRTLTAVVLVLGSLLPACAPSSQVSPELRADILACLPPSETFGRSAGLSAAHSEGLYTTRPGQARFERCMYDRGWKLKEGR
jgi:hypothetical protein